MSCCRWKGDGPRNVQTIPRDDKVVKAGFVPKQDAFLFLDYPNIELKLLAFYLEAVRHPSMAQVFRDGADLHKETAAGIYKVASNDVTDAQRQTGKRLNFSIVYGGGIPTLMEQLRLDKKQALALLRSYHKTWPGIGWQGMNRSADEGTLAWQIKKRLDDRGYITTLWGRHLRPHSGHVALNALCQGCAADLMKAALIKVDAFLKQEGFKSHLVNVVHDELILDCVASEIPVLVKKVPDLMNYEPVDRVVPIKPEPDISYTTWADKAPYEGAE